jgi:VanZ family protein
MNQPSSAFPLSRQHLFACALTYLLLILYASTIVGPSGLNFVALDPAEAWHRFLAIRFIPHGSDQRADWFGNLLMLVPLGFCLTGAAWPARPGLRPLAVLAAILNCGTAIVVIKYLQLYFPPRTVSLNYIAAQATGAVIGSVSFPLLRNCLVRSLPDNHPVDILLLALRLYSIALLAFLLMPLDFALDAADLHMQFSRLPDTFLALPGPERPFGQRVITILVAAAAFMPVGALLAFENRNPCRGLLTVAARGALLATGVYLLSTLVISAYPGLPAILFRTAGIVAGAAATRWLAAQDIERLHRRLHWLAPWTILPYTGCLLIANRLLSLHYIPLDQAVAQANPLGFLPLYDYYIVTKAQAAKNIIGHAALYMPIGILSWLRLRQRVGAKAFGTAALVSLVAETARYFRPGQEGDINAVLLAGLASLLTARAMPMIWSIVQGLASARHGAKTQPFNRPPSAPQPGPPNPALRTSRQF